MKTTGIMMITAFLILTISSVKTLAASNEDTPYFSNIKIYKEGPVVGDGDSIFVTCELLNSLVSPEYCIATIDAGESNDIKIELVLNPVSGKYEGCYTFGSTADNPARACYIMTVESGDIVSKEHSDFESPEFYYCNTCKNGTHYPVVVHESQNPTCTSLGNSEKIKCSLCGAVISELEIIPALGHAWDSKPTTDKKATCTGGGLQSIHCSRCSETKDVKAIPATGHSYGEWSITKEPTCTEEGSRKLKKISVIQIQYSRDRNFINGVKTVTAKKKTTSKIISKLNSKKTYYIRIRVYKKSGNEVHVSSWSAVKKVKVK